MPPIYAMQRSKLRASSPICARQCSHILPDGVSRRGSELSRAYLEDVTAAEFCEEGGHGLEVGEA